MKKLEENFERKFCILDLDLKIMNVLSKILLGFAIYTLS